MSGVVVNVIAVIAGSTLGILFGNLIPERFRDIAFQAIGTCTIALGALMAVNGYNDLSATDAGSMAALVLVGSLIVGSLLGELLRLEDRLEGVGGKIQKALYRVKSGERTRRQERDEAVEREDVGTSFVEGFMTASLLFCVGAMTVLGSIQDGLGDPSLLYLKAMLDGVAAIALATALGVGVGFSALTVLVIQGGIALCVAFVGDFFTPAIIASINACGGAMMIALGINILGIKKLRVGNMLPAIVVAGILGGILG